MVDEATHIVVSRQLLSDLSRGVKDVKENGVEVCEALVEEISKRLVSFEEPVSVLREYWADLLEAEEEYEDAARVLEGMCRKSRTKIRRRMLSVSCPQESCWILRIAR